MNMKNTLLLKAVLLLILSVSLINTEAQDTLTNQGLNRWEKSGKQPPFDWSEPQGWTSSNALTEFISAGVSEVTLPQSGSSQAQLKTINVFGQDVPAVLINGDFPISISDTARFPLLGGEPMTTVKTKFYGMYNFTSSTVDDSATVVVAFKKFNTTTQKPDLIAIGDIYLPTTTSGLHPFSFNIDAVKFDTPDSVVVTILSSKVDNFKSGGTLTIDYTGFDKPSNLKEIMPTQTKVYPSPANNTITLQTSLNGFSYSIYDVTGKTQLSGTTNQYNTTIDIRDFKGGLYFVHINGANVKPIKFIKTY